MPRLGRRGFLRLAAASALLRPARAVAEPERPTAAGVHRATRNTWHGPTGLGSLLAPRPPPSKPYPGAPRLPLPAGAALASRTLAEAVRGYAPARAFSGAPLPFAALASLLDLTNGVTGVVKGSQPPAYRRAAPSAGALYAGEVYVVAERIRGLAPGVYSYAVLENALVPIRSGAALGEVARAVETPGALDGAACAVLLSNVFGRYAWRYGARGYRYALIDSGHIGENLRLAAAASELGHARFPRFEDDALNALLGIDGREEAVCALHVLGCGSEGAGAAPSRSLVERREAAASLSVVERYHEATKLVPGPAAAPAPLASAPGLEAPAGPAPAVSVARAIRQRRSAQGFRAEAITQAQLGFVLALAQRPGPASRVVAHRVDGLAPGLYTAAPELIRAGALEGRMVRACLFQEKAGTAAAACAFVADLGCAARAGERCYRDELLEAGAAAERVYLAAESLGLRARNLAAFYDDSLNDLLGLDGREHAVIHLTLLGHGTENGDVG